MIMWRKFKGARDPISSYSHFWGIVLAGIGLGFIVAFGVATGANRVDFIASVVFALSMLALYTASTVYHFSRGRADRVRRLRKFDHAMIYVLIAGTYTPVIAHFCTPLYAAVFLSVLWAFALGGIIMKLCWINAPNWLSAVIYIVMGWAIAFDPRIFTRMNAGMIGFLLAGGISYTVGGVIYALKKPNWFQAFGFHELFHLFILGGTVFHFFAIFNYVLLSGL